MSDISVVIPTLWLSGILPQIIGTLESCPEIDRIIIIDNDPKRRLTIRGSKLTIIANSKNIYVNPAWNRAVSLCLGDLVCFLNDDVLPSAELFKYVRDLFSTDSKQKIGMVGLNWSWPNGNIEFTPVGWRTSNWFGSAWFIQKYITLKSPWLKSGEVKIGICANSLTGKQEFSRLVVSCRRT